MKVGEAGLVTTAGAEFMPLDTTEDAGTWRARKSAPGLVGSSVGGWRGKKGKGEAGGEEKVKEKDGIGLGVRGKCQEGKREKDKRGLY